MANSTFSEAARKETPNLPKPGPIKTLGVQSCRCAEYDSGGPVSKTHACVLRGLDMFQSGPWPDRPTIMSIF